MMPVNVTPTTNMAFRMPKMLLRWMNKLRVTTFSSEQMVRDPTAQPRTAGLLNHSSSSEQSGEMAFCM